MAGSDKTSYNNDSTESHVYTKKPIGYADGYSDYIRKSGARNADGTRNDVHVTNVPTEEHVKSMSPELLIDYHSNKFRRINGFSQGFEDPTFLIFDLYIMKSESSLFREDVIKSYLNEYYDYIPELKEREGYWEEFVTKLTEFFPVDGNVGGEKRHYIESISNLDVLLKPIINYPEDNIIFTLSEDVSMSLQYLTELYNNLIYSYDTHRYLIPDNLLRFDIRITIRDLRNFRKPNTASESTKSSIVNDDVSKFIYVLHDCQFNFFNTRNFGNDIKIAGFNAGSINTPANGSFSINFKSYSKITAPLLIDNSKIIDFREREAQIENKKDFYRSTFNNDYKSSDEIIQIEKMDEQNKNIKYRTTSDINEGELNKIGNLQLPDINTSVRGFLNNVKEEIIQVRDVIIKQVYEEVNQLITEGQRFIGDKLGFTIGKTNVYYSSVNEKINRFSHMFEDFVDDTVDNWKGQQDSVKAKLSKENRYGKNYLDTEHFNEKYPDSDNTVIQDVHPDGIYNEKYPEGDVFPDGQYNIKFPDGNVQESYTYNEKYPDGDLNDDGQYNIKFPDGNVSEEGIYNEKYPDGDVNPDGQYNIKFPDGNVYK